LCDRCVALQTLGLVSTASVDQIENAYRTLVKVWHPDRFQSDPRVKEAADEKLKEINAAHDYLASAPPKPAPAAPIRRPESAPFEEKATEPPQRKTIPFVHDPEAEESEEVRRILRRYQGHKSTVPRALVTSGIALSTVAMFALLWFIVDAFLSSNQSTAPAWNRKKSELSLELHSAGTRLWSGASENLKDANSQIAPAQVPDTTQTNPAVATSLPDNSEHKGAHDHGKASGQLAGAPGHTIGAQPYITAGLSPAEVLSVLGNPTSSSGEKMFYKGSEIDFQNGQVVGWKIDPRSAPLRVKLWPDTAPVPGLTTFRVGSSKGDVIALQGTPTLFSRNEFGYGGSVVFFQNDHVVGWKEDPASVRLKVAR
jgi:hypothetical protein